MNTASSVVLPKATVLAMTKFILAAKFRSTSEEIAMIFELQLRTTQNTNADVDLTVEQQKLILDILNNPTLEVSGTQREELAGYRTSLSQA